MFKWKRSKRNKQKKKTPNNPSVSRSWGSEIYFIEKFFMVFFLTKKENSVLTHCILKTLLT